MQTFIPVSVTASPAWLKNAARVAFLLLFVKGAAWVAMTWLAYRGFSGI